MGDVKRSKPTISCEAEITENEIRSLLNIPGKVSDIQIKAYALERYIAVEWTEEVDE